MQIKFKKKNENKRGYELNTYEIGTGDGRNLYESGDTTLFGRVWIHQIKQRTILGKKNLLFQTNRNPKAANIEERNKHNKK